MQKEDYIINPNNLNTQIVGPIILQVSNPSSSAVLNFDIFNSQYLIDSFVGGTWNAEGDFTFHKVTIKSLLRMSYQQILLSIQNNPFTAGAVYLESIEGSPRQIKDIYSLTSVFKDNKLYIKEIHPFSATYVLQSGITYNTEPFNIDSLTKLTWKIIYASTVFQISIFPIQIIDPNLALCDIDSQTSFIRPNVIGNLLVR